MIRGVVIEKLDVSTVGVLMYELLQGRTQLGLKSDQKKRLSDKITEENILQCKLEFDLKISPEAEKAIRKMLVVSEDARPTTKEVLELSFFKEFNFLPESIHQIRDQAGLEFKFHDFGTPFAN